MNLHILIALISSVIMFILGIFVITRDLKNRLYQVFFLFNTSAAIWVFNSFLLWSSKDFHSAFMWKGANFVLSVFIPAFFMHLSFIIIGEVRKFRKLLITIYVICAFFSLWSQTPLFITNVTAFSDYFKFIPTTGILFIPFMIFFYGSAAFVYFRLLRAAREASGNLRIQIQYIILGTILGFVSSLIYFLLLYKINIEKFLPHDLLTLSYSFIIAYAIVRHQLLEIEVIIKKTLVFAGLFAAAAAVFILPTLIIQEFIVGQLGLGARVAGLSISAVLIVLILRRVENFLIDITDKFLFQKKYDYKELLKTFSTEVLTVLDKDILVHTTVDRLSNIMKIQSCGILLFNKDKNLYELGASIGIGKDWSNITLGLDNTLTAFLNRTKSYLSTKHQGKDSPIPKRIAEDMNKLNLELAIPLIIHEDMIGILTLGKKKSDEDYTQDDMDILLPLARTLSIAISNAMALDELGKTQAEAAQQEKMAVIGTLSAGINHEICNPLGIARGQCEAFLLNVKDGLYKNKSQKELLDKAMLIMGKVIHETDRATAITKRLSTFAKPSKGLTEDINIREEIDEVLALVGYEMKLDNIDVINDVPKDSPHIIGDKKQLQEVFFNLIRNAAQAIKEKGKITVESHEDNGRVYVEIDDTGEGIPEDKINQIFNPFYTTKDPGKGTGLGLFIVRQVVERNKGRISVRSKVGEGTTFTLEFPVGEIARV